MKIKAIASSLVLLIMGMLLVSCGSDATPTPPPTIKVKLLSSWSPVLEFANVTEAAVFDTIREKTNGVVDIERVAGPESVPTFEQFVPVRDGLFDALSTTITYHPEFTDIGSVHNYYDIVSNPYADRLSCGSEDMIRSVYDTHNVKYLGIAHLFVGVRTFLKDKPANLMDLSGSRIRSGGSSSSVLLKKLKASTVVVPFPEIYQALERGVIDGMVIGGGASVAQALSWDEVVNYHVSPPLGETQLIYIMNMDTWNQIPAEYQTIVLDSFTDINAKLGEALVKLDKDALVAMEAKGTLEEIKLDDATWKFWDAGNREAGLGDLKKKNPSLATKIDEFDSCMLGKR